MPNGTVTYGVQTFQLSEKSNKQQNLNHIFKVTLPERFSNSRKKPVKEEIDKL
jgi:hypothetical protein